MEPRKVFFKKDKMETQLSKLVGLLGDFFLLFLYTEEDEETPCGGLVFPIEGENPLLSIMGSLKKTPDGDPSYRTHEGGLMCTRKGNQPKPPCVLCKNQLKRLVGECKFGDCSPLPK